MRSDLGSKIIRILTGVAILTLIASLLVPVWSMESAFTIGDFYTDDNDYYAYGMNEKTTSFGDTEETTTMLADLDSGLQGPLVTFIVMTVIALFLSLMAFFNDFKWRSAKVRTITLASSALIALISPLLFMINWTDAMNSDSSGYEFAFSGKDSGYGFSIVYGPEYGWYLQFVSFGLLAIALFLSLRMDKKGRI